MAGLERSSVSPGALRFTPFLDIVRNDIKAFLLLLPLALLFFPRAPFHLPPLPRFLNCLLPLFTLFPTCWQTIDEPIELVHERFNIALLTDQGLSFAAVLTRDD